MKNTPPLQDINERKEFENKSNNRLERQLIARGKKTYTSDSISSFTEEPTPVRRSLSTTNNKQSALPTLKVPFKQRVLNMLSLKSIPLNSFLPRSSNGFLILGIIIGFSIAGITIKEQSSKINAALFKYSITLNELSAYVNDTSAIEHYTSTTLNLISDYAIEFFTIARQRTKELSLSFSSTENININELNQLLQEKISDTTLLLGNLNTNVHQVISRQLASIENTNHNFTDNKISEQLISPPLLHDVATEKTLHPDKDLLAVNTPLDQSQLPINKQTPKEIADHSSTPIATTPTEPETNLINDTSIVETATEVEIITLKEKAPTTHLIEQNLLKEPIFQNHSLTSLSPHIPIIKFATSIERYQPVGDPTSIKRNKNGIAKIFLYAMLKNLTGKTITHTWYLDDIEMAKIPISVKTPYWRAYSSKNISSNMTGHWSIKITDENDTQLAVAHFDHVAL